jgi:hypothetical protein
MPSDPLHHRPVQRPLPRHTNARKNLTAYFEIVRSVLLEVAHTGDYALGDALSAGRARQPA